MSETQKIRKPAVPIWGELLDACPAVTKKNMTNGTGHEEDMVLCPGACNGNFPSGGSKLILEIAYGIDKDYYPLTSSGKTVFVIHRSESSTSSWWNLESTLTSPTSELSSLTWRRMSTS
jgi:hypothetical protein